MYVMDTYITRNQRRTDRNGDSILSALSINPINYGDRTRFGNSLFVPVKGILEAMKPNYRPSMIALFWLTLAALACNFPGTEGAATDATATAGVFATQTAANLRKANAGNEALFMTQTAAIPTATPTPSQTPTVTPTRTPPPSATTDPNVPTVAGTPTQTSIAKETLKVGVEVIVRTGGEALRLRDVPGLVGKQLAQLPGDARLKIIGGPQAADGFLWWQVNVLTAPGGNATKTGWVSEQANNRQTIEVAK